jgi:hypothetical protein
MNTLLQAPDGACRASYAKLVILDRRDEPGDDGLWVENAVF